jgi:hypothetical protein
MGREQYETELRQALRQLELSLETPVVAGELPDWATAVQDSLACVGVLLTRQIEILHADEFAEIVEEDSGLLTRVDRLTKEDGQVAEQFAELSQRAARLTESAWGVEPDEGQLRPDVERLVDSGLSFVTRVRKQETAITTWLLEAFDRDRGTVD